MSSFIWLEVRQLQMVAGDGHIGNAGSMRAAAYVEFRLPAALRLAHRSHGEACMKQDREKTEITYWGRKERTMLGHQRLRSHRASTW